MPQQHSRLYPWYIGVAIIAAFEVAVGFMFFGASCRAPAIPQILILAGLPIVYLALMFMALRSQP